MGSSTVTPQSYWGEILRLIPEGVTVVDADGRLLFANEMAAQICGCDSEADMLEAGIANIRDRFEVLDSQGASSLAQGMSGGASDEDESGVTFVRYRDLTTREERWSQLYTQIVKLPELDRPVSLNVFHDVTTEVRNQNNLSFLARASELLAQSLDHDVALQNLTKLAVPTIADWCTIDLIREDGSVENVAIAHVDPEKVAYARELQRRFPFDPEAKTGVANVLRTREPELIPEISDELIAAIVDDGEMLRIVQELQLSSSMCVPLRFRDQIFGAITFVATESRHRYDAQDLDLAADLARRAAMALANARLYREAHRVASEQAAMIAQMADAVIVADANGIVTFANQAAHDFFATVEVGAPVEKARPRVIFHRTDESVLSEEEIILRRAVHGETTMNELLRVEREGAEDIYLHTSAIPLRGDDGEPFGAVTVSRDVTAQQEFDRQKEAFLLSASHDLKNPLTLIKGTAQLLEQKATRSGSDSEWIESLQRVATTAGRMSDMLNEMLDMSRLQMGRPIPVDSQVADLVAIVQAAVELTQGGSDHVPIQFETAQSQIVCELDPLRIERVVQNLLSNAVKFSDKREPVTVELTLEDSEWAVITVSDHGVGILSDDLPTIFDQFGRGRNVEGKISGSGIGLAATKHIVEQHGGTISVTSEVNDGSVFTVRLPLRQGPEESPVEPE